MIICNVNCYTDNIGNTDNNRDMENQKIHLENTCTATCGTSRVFHSCLTFSHTNKIKTLREPYMVLISRYITVFRNDTLK